MEIMEIPANPTPRDFNAEVNCAIQEVLKEMGLSSGPINGRPEQRTGVLSVNHGRGHFHVMNDVAAEVAKRFKEKGYYVHYCRSLAGTVYALEITTYPVNHDA